MAVCRGFAIKQLAGLLDSNAFTAIKPDGSWNNFYLNNTVDVTMRTTLDDVSTEVTIAAGSGFSLIAPQPYSAGARFQSNMAAFYLKPVSGDGAGLYVVWA